MTKRIIPCLDLQNGKVVKGVKFQNVAEVRDPIALAAAYSSGGADGLVMYDINASYENRSIALNLVEKVASVVSIPFIVGGGIRSLEDIRNILQAGADKVSITSAAVLNPKLITAAAQEFGSNRIIAAIDAKEAGGRWHVTIQGGRTDTGRDAVEWAQELESLGAGELVLNSIDTDGVREGYSIELTRSVAEAVAIPVIASGGAGTMEHFYEVLTTGKAAAALAASVFHFGLINVRELKEYLWERGVPVRRAQ